MPRRPATPRLASLGFEQKLWEVADLLRGSLDAANYKHVVLGLLFLRAATGEGSALALPVEVRWARLAEAVAAHTDPGAVLHGAMDALEAANPGLAGALPRVFRDPGLTREVLVRLVGIVSDLEAGEAGGQDVLGRVWEYFLGRFAAAEGRGGGEFYTPACVVRLLVEMLEPASGVLYDPCCGSGGMFVQSARLLAAHRGGGRLEMVGQESNPRTWGLARMNLALRGMAADLGPGPADTLQRDLHPSLQADIILANPPFNASDWVGPLTAMDPRWRYGLPPAGNANFAWVQHMVHHLGPRGIAGFVLANGSLIGRQGGEGEIRRRLVEADLVDCIVALPEQLFYGTPIPACVWVVGRDRGPASGRRDRRGHTLFVDGRALGRMETRTHRVLDPEDVGRVAGAWHRWRDGGERWEDEPGFCRVAALEEIRAADFQLNPGRYVAASLAEDDGGVPLPELWSRLEAALAEAHRLDAEILAIRERLR